MLHEVGQYMLNEVRNWLKKTKNSLVKFSSFLWSKVCFWKTDDDMIIAPCVGDIIEYENGQRSMVMVVDINDNDLYDVRFSKGVLKTVNSKGRRKTSSAISDAPEAWPPVNSKVFRDSLLIIPQKEWRVNFIVWLSNKILKK